MRYGRFERATLRRVKLTRPSGLTLLAGALLLLMPALALLQFRWVGEVSDAAHERMRRNLDNTAAQFRFEFDTNEIRFALNQLSVGAATVNDKAWDRYDNRYDEWVNLAPHTGIVKNVYLVTNEAGEVAALHWNTDDRAFDPVPWPDILEPWHGDFEKELADFSAGRVFPERGDRFPNEGPQSALLISNLRNNQIPGPSRATAATGTRQQISTRVFGFTVIELDMPFILDKVLPELVEKHFSHANGDLYRVAIVDSDNVRHVIFRSDDSAPTDAAHADTTQGLFTKALGRLPSGQPPAPDGRRGPPVAPRADGRPVADQTRQGLPGLPRVGALDDVPVRWRVLVQHRSGSLEAAVNGARTRNLALSFGVLLLLTFTIGLLTVTSRRAQQIARQQMEFVAGVSHELRTPVAVIKSAAENLSQGVVGNPERVKRYGKMIETEARRLGEMVERVLQYAGIESGLGYGARSPLSPNEIIDGAVESALPLLGPDAVHVQRDVPDSLPPVLGDAAALRSVVQNLFMNAVKYGGPDRWVGIKAEHVRQGRAERVRITVSDHGPGIPDNELPRIFDPFYRGDEALSKQIHGNGLGLSLVKKIVTAHGGQVSVATKPGAGSAFTIELPATDADVTASDVTSGVRAAVHP
jgi:signal transduction histidine kinase